jgi:ERCC4-type nuclease
LKKSGITNVIYLVEGFDATIMNRTAMYSALTETMIYSDFFLKVTNDIDDTIDYLAELTRQLIHQHHVIIILKIEPRLVHIR